MEARGILGATGNHFCIRPTTAIEHRHPKPNPLACRDKFHGVLLFQFSTANRIKVATGEIMPDSVLETRHLGHLTTTERLAVCSFPIILASGFSPQNGHGNNSLMLLTLWGVWICDGCKYRYSTIRHHQPPPRRITICAKCQNPNTRHRV